jgi:hypothetical protein
VSTVDVDLAVLASIATGLDAGADGLENLAGSVPSGVDAGPMTAVIASMIGQVVDSAGNVSESLSGVAELVRTARGYYERADADGAASLAEIEEAMDE